MLDWEWDKAKECILDHAHGRLRDHSEIGGTDFEIADDTCKEVCELCIKVATGELTLSKLQKKLKC